MRSVKTIMIGLSLLCGALSAHAENYPDRDVTVISAYPPGGGVDITARIVAAELSHHLGQSVIVDNKPGAAGVVGTTAATHATPDGYTILITANPSITIVPFLSHVGYDPVKDLIPIAKVAISPTIIAVPTESPYHTLKDLVDAARQSSSKVTVGVPGVGSTPQIELAILSDLTKGHITSIPYRGATFIISDVLGGQISAGAMALPAIVPQITGGKMRGLAVVSPTRSAILPDVPTVQEALGVQLDGFPTWYGFFAPAGTPPAAIKRLEADILATMKEPSVVTKMKKFGTETLQTGSKAFAKEDENEIATLKRAIKKNKLSIQ